MSFSDTLDFSRAHHVYLQPPDYPEARVQIEGCFEAEGINDLEFDTGELEEISIIDAGFDPETNILKIWVSAWMTCEQDGDYKKSGFGDLQSVEVVDTEGVDHGPDPDEDWDLLEDN